MGNTGTIRSQSVRSDTTAAPRKHVMRTTLEKQVRKRTARLSEVNELLKKEIAERRQMEADLQDSHERLRYLSMHLQKIREDERTSLSRELHDEFGQSLTGMKLDVSWIKRRLTGNDGPIIERLDSILEALDRTIDTVQHMSARLRPVILDDFGLRDAAELAARDLKKRANISCNVISDPYNISLNDMVSTEAFRILQESLTNVMRHSRATEVTIILRKKKDILAMEIRDNGKGITKKELADPRSFGLTGMQERAHMLGGTLSIMGIRGKGTTVALNVPLRRANAQGKEE
ncbi:MAG: signal transduction histidine kinase [Deltaproteobacteria bacterium]|nr:signal transduction histidine kinase [Deltaproteobacteria bacterium]